MVEIIVWSLYQLFIKRCSINSISISSELNYEILNLNLGCFGPWSFGPAGWASNSATQQLNWGNWVNWGKGKGNSGNYGLRTTDSESDSDVYFSVDFDFAFLTHTELNWINSYRPIDESTQRHWVGGSGFRMNCITFRHSVESARWPVGSNFIPIKFHSILISMFLLFLLMTRDSSSWFMIWLVLVLVLVPELNL